MDIKDAKRALDLQIEQRIRVFEQETGCTVTGIKIKRDEQGVTEVKTSVEL